MQSTDKSAASRHFGPLRQLVVSACAALWLCHSAHAATTISPSDLKHPAEATVLHFDKDFRFDRPGAAKADGDRQPQSGLQAGDYVAEYEDDDGVFYRGNGSCVLMLSLPARNLQVFADGGIWLPRTPGKPYRLYRYALEHTERVAAITPDANGQWSVDFQHAGMAMLAVGIVPRKEQVVDVAPSTLCGPVVQPSGAAASGAGVAVNVVDAAHPRTGAVGGAIGSAIVNAMIADGKGKIVLLPEPPTPTVPEGTFTRR